MKKFISLCLLLAWFAALPPAYADLLWEPDNDFYRDHAAACTSLNRMYLANGPDGSVTLYDAPGSSVAVAQMENGTRLWIAFQYQDWGCSSSVDAIGWAPLEQLSVVYDNLSFTEEYGSQFQAYQGEFAGYDNTADGIVFWEYPGAPEPKETWEPGYEILEDIIEAFSDGNCFSYTFTDEEGYRWGFVNYLYHCRNFWVCLDEPAKTDFPVREIPPVEIIPPQKALLPASMRLPALLVLAVAGLTGGLLAGVYFKKKKG